jgi:hypothetical protein
MAFVDYYAILGVPRHASTEEIRRAFSAKALALDPGNNYEDPDVARQLQLLTQANQTLTDPQRRRQYDATLPAPGMPTPDVNDVYTLWKATGQKYFAMAKRFEPAIDALRHSVPLALEGDLLIVGMPPQHGTLTGYLTAAVTHGAVRKILIELSGRPLDYRVIAGSTLQDWLTLKQAEERLRERRQRQHISATKSDDLLEQALAEELGAVVDTENWDAWLDEVATRWAALPSRTYPQVCARFLLEQLAALAEMEARARAAGMDDETRQQQVGRVLERLASLCEIPGGVVGLQYMQLCNAHEHTPA